MTLCNMAVEFSAFTGLIAPDHTTIDYLRGKPYAPVGTLWDDAVQYWQQLSTDKDATFDREIVIDCTDIEPQVTWGTSPEHAIPINGLIATAFGHEAQASGYDKALEYMGLTAGQPIAGQPIDCVFIGSCTNARISDLRLAASILRGNKIRPGMRAICVPGSMQVKAQAETEGLDRIFIDAGFEWREAGCSMCLAMNPDQLSPGERCAATSNRNFEGRQGRGGRTHLMSPAMAAAASLTGYLTDIRKLKYN